MKTDKEIMLDVIKNLLTAVLESEIIVEDKHSDAFKFDYLKGTINTVIEFINDHNK